MGFAGKGRIVVGERAKNCRPMIYDAKRLIGKPFEKAQAEGHMSNWDFQVEEGTNGRCQIRVPGREPLAIEQISSYVLDAMRKAAEQRLGG